MSRKLVTVPSSLSLPDVSSVLDLMESISFESFGRRSGIQYDAQVTNGIAANAGFAYMTVNNRSFYTT